MKPAAQNQQSPEPYAKDSGSFIDLHSAFHTIQGEGPFVGQPSFFTRLAGCNLQCPWCDTEYTEGRHSMGMAQMVKLYDDFGHKHPKTHLVVITGGEPLRQNLDPLVHTIVSSFGWHVQIETNGLLPLSEKLITFISQRQLTVVCSPKTHRIHETVALHAAALKYVIDAEHVDPDDGLPTLALAHKVRGHVARPMAHRRNMPIYVSPCDELDLEKNFRNMIVAREMSLKFGYTMGIQLHKIIDIP